jgi:hypothetical protein
VTIDDDEAHDALSLGSIVGGGTQSNRVWRDAIRDLTRRVSAARADVEGPLSLNGPPTGTPIEQPPRCPRSRSAASNLHHGVDAVGQVRR